MKRSQENALVEKRKWNVTNIYLITDYKSTIYNTLHMSEVKLGVRKARPFRWTESALDLHLIMMVG